MKQPNRLSLLGGKLAGLVTFAAAVLLLFAGMTFVLSLGLTPTQDLSTSAWFSIHGLTEAAGDYANAVPGVCLGLLRHDAGRPPALHTGDARRRHRLGRAF